MACSNCTVPGSFIPFVSELDWNHWLTIWWRRLPHGGNNQKEGLLCTPCPTSWQEVWQQLSALCLQNSAVNAVPAPGGVATAVNSYPMSNNTSIQIDHGGAPVHQGLFITGIKIVDPSPIFLFSSGRRPFWAECACGRENTMVPSCLGKKSYRMWYRLLMSHSTDIPARRAQMTSFDTFVAISVTQFYQTNFVFGAVKLMLGWGRRGKDNAWCQSMWSLSQHNCLSLR